MKGKTGKCVAYFNYKDGTLAGVDLVRGEEIPEGLYHIVCDVIVKHKDGDYLLMHRDSSKECYGGYYEATAGGSALKGEDKVSCAKRELLEETGISANDFTEIGQYTSHDTIYYQFLCVTDCEKSSILLQEGETISYKWVSENDFISFVNSNEMIDIQNALHNYLKKHVDGSQASIDKLAKILSYDNFKGLIRENNEFLEATSNDIDDSAFIWWLAATAALSPD